MTKAAASSGATDTAGAEPIAAGEDGPWPGDSTYDSPPADTAENPPADDSEAQSALSKEETEKILREVYGESARWLREKYRDEFDAHRAELAEKRGVQWTPRPRPHERARQTILDLVKENPELADADPRFKALLDETSN